VVEVGILVVGNLLEVDNHSLVVGNLLVVAFDTF